VRIVVWIPQLGGSGGVVVVEGEAFVSDVVTEAFFYIGDDAVEEAGLAEDVAHGQSDTAFKVWRVLRGHPKGNGQANVSLIKVGYVIDEGQLVASVDET
jgi:hypothetical protein